MATSGVMSTTVNTTKEINPSRNIWIKLQATMT